MNNRIQDLVETRNFPDAEKCTCNEIRLESQNLGDAFNDQSISCPYCRNAKEVQNNSIGNLDEIEEVVFESAPEFLSDQYIGKKLNEFVIQDRIGSGGMARVYLARDEDLKRHVAVKIIQNRNYVSLDSQASLLRAEAISQASIHHPNVVGIYHVGNHEGIPYMVMEYVDGGSLMEKIKSGNLAFNEILSYTQQIIEGLAEASRIGLIHGDIKPANLLIDDCGLVKLSDFGLARHVSDENAFPKMLVGTPSFMAPELFERQPNDTQTDLFSLGVTLFEMTFGQVPYTLTGNSVEEIKENFKVAEIEFPKTWPEDFPEWWREILVRLLAKDRSQRYADISDLESDLKRQIERPAAAKAVPKLCSFLLENLIFGFICLPMLGVLTTGGHYLDSDQKFLLGLTALAGPIAFFALTVWTGRSLGQFMFNTRLLEIRARQTRTMAVAKYQFLQLLPTICVFIGGLIHSKLGRDPALTMIACGIGIGICHIANFFASAGRPTFLERTSNLEVVVDI